MIPKSFQVLGHTIKVKITNDIDPGSVGIWKGNKQEISILPVSDTFPKSLQEQTFWHEVMHCIFSMLSYDEYDKDEALVDRISQCLYQIDKTRK